jgi:hypothetical protein
MPLASLQAAVARASHDHTTDHHHPATAKRSMVSHHS